MSRAQRLLTLLQVLRRYRFPVAGAVLARELDISLRTLYRDIGTLKEQGADIEGEAGMGFLLRPGFLLPPLMFGEDEIEALVLGVRWVAARADDDLGQAARSALDKIAAVLPVELRNELDASALLVAPSSVKPVTPKVGPQLLRQAIRSENKAQILYQDVKDEQTARTIWPFALAYFDGVQLLVAWCELRESFRHFRVDRIHELTLCEERYPRRRQALLKAWQQTQGADCQ